MVVIWKEYIDYYQHHNDSCDPEPQTAEIEDQTPRSSGDQARDQPDEMAKFWIKVRQPFRKTVFFFPRQHYSQIPAH